MRRSVIVPAALLAAALAGCGGGTTHANTATTVSNAAASSSGPSTTFKPSGSSSSKFCDDARNLSKSQQLNPGTDLKKTYQELNSLGPRVESEAPSSIKADVHTVFAALNSIGQALAAVNYDISKVNPAQLQAFSTQQFKDATTRIDAYLTQVCGVTSTTA